jgi:hypothetical protein
MLLSPLTEPNPSIGEQLAMKRHPCFLLTAALMVGLAIHPSARADLFAPGATLQVTYTDPSTSTQHTETVPFQPNGAATLLDGGALSISEQTLVVDSKTEWVQFYLTTTNGGPLDTQSGGYFLVNFNNVPLTEAAGWTSVFAALTDNGATTGRMSFYSTYATDPVTPSLGIVNLDNFGSPLTTSPFYGTVFFPTPPASYAAYWYPYSGYLNAWGANPDANGFVFGVELQAVQPFTAAPEPSTLALGTAGLFSLVSGSWWRRRRAA